MGNEKNQGFSMNQSRSKEVKYYGIHACLSIFENRPSSIIRIYVSKDNLGTFSSALKWCAKQKKSYHIVEEEELCKITTSTHHEGVCILAKEKPSLFFKDLPLNEKCMIYLDGVENPHNLGSIIRTCTNFDISYILGQKNKLPSLSPSACRVAKGGAEIVSLVNLEGNSDLKKLKDKGFILVATDSKKGISLYDYLFSKKTVFILGAEDKGISQSVMKEADVVLNIPGSGKIESLNVSVAAALFLGEYWRQTSPKKSF